MLVDIAFDDVGQSTSAHALNVVSRKLGATESMTEHDRDGVDLRLRSGLEQRGFDPDSAALLGAFGFDHQLRRASAADDHLIVGGRAGASSQPQFGARPSRLNGQEAAGPLPADACSNRRGPQGRLGRQCQLQGMLRLPSTCFHSASAGMMGVRAIAGRGGNGSRRTPVGSE